MGKLIFSIKTIHPETDISILIYKEYSSVAHCLRNINKTYKIDKTKVKSLQSSPLFCDSFALNEFMSPLRKIKNLKWSYVLNLSHCSISNHLTSYLANQKHIGVCMNRDKSINYSNGWAKVYHEILQVPFRTGLSSIEILHQMIGVDLKTHNNHAQLIFYDETPIANKMLDIRKNHQSPPSSDFKVAGVLIENFFIEDKISLDTIHDFFNISMQRNEFLPILLISSSKHEKDMANRLQNLLSKDIYIFEYNTKTLPTILLHLDFILTSNPLAIAMGDLTETPTIEICLKENVLFNQSSTLEGSIIIEHISHTGAPISSTDLLKACHLIYQKKNIPLNFSRDIMAYKVHHKNNRCEYIPISEHFEAEKELTRFISKDILYLYNDSSRTSLLFSSLYKNLFHKEDLKKWIDKEKNTLSRFLKNLLNCLRLINQARQREDQGKIFVKELDSLLNLAYQNSIFSIPIHIFRANIESIHTSDYDSNINMIEKELFELKKYLQETFKIIDLLAEDNSDLLTHRETHPSNSSPKPILEKTNQNFQENHQDEISLEPTL
ncbi:MAG: hypothetical protein OXB88_07930 [Bacteriovoracales bacterium]|nr:hypothetical protein [Bacteriovoracales bacterium]